MKTGRTALAAAGLGAGLAVAACTPAAPGAVPPPTATPPRSVTATGSPASTTDPAAAVVAAVRGYYDELNRALRTGRTERLATLTTADCSCRPLLAYVRDRWRQGSVRAAGYALHRLDVTWIGEAVASVRVVYAVSPVEEYDRAGRLVRTVPAVPAGRADVELVRRGDRWLVHDVARWR